MNVILKSDIEYKQWLTDLKFRIRNSQIKAALKVNTELINLYWKGNCFQTGTITVGGWLDKTIKFRSTAGIS